jgi:predicted transcriptional regulator
MEGLRRKTHIMQRANLSTDMTNDYLQYLLERDLIKHEHTKKTKGYSVTEKGIAFLRRYLEIKNLIGED